MKILSHGTKGDKKHKTTCRECGCRFEFQESEGIKDKDRDGLHVKIACPDCATMAYIAL